jgi:hypothetical protein
MNRRFSTFTLLAALLLVCAGSIAFAQDTQVPTVYPNEKPMFIAGAHRDIAPAPAATNLSSWNGTFTDITHVKRTFVMVGKNPATSNVTTTIPIVYIPIKFVYDKNHGNRTFDPNKNKFKGTTVSVSKTILASPIFQSEVDFVQGGTDLGTTQYIDAFQRGNFWGKNVKKNTSYHTLLGKAKIAPEQTFNCNQSSCIVSTQFGHIVGLFDFGAMDNVLQGYITKLGIKPNQLPVFLAYDVYLTSGGCCIGGYHFVNGGPPTGQTYSFSTVHDQGGGVFSQDTAALSHEIGEWQDNPFFGSNTVGCNDNSQLEVGDPLVLDDHPYTVNGFVYHLQDLVFLPYFGAPKSTSLLQWFSFQNDKKTLCPGQ